MLPLILAVVLSRGTLEIGLVSLVACLVLISHRDNLREETVARWAAPKP